MNLKNSSQSNNLGLIISYRAFLKPNDISGLINTYRKILLASAKHDKLTAIQPERKNLHRLLLRDFLSLVGTQLMAPLETSNTIVLGWS